MKTIEQEAVEQLREQGLRRTVDDSGNITEILSASAQDRVALLRERLMNRQQAMQQSPMQHASNLADSVSRGDIEAIIKNGVQTAIASLQHVMSAVETQEALSFDAVGMREPKPAPDVTLDLTKVTDAIPDLSDMTRRNP